MSYEPLALRVGVLEIFQDAQEIMFQRAAARRMIVECWRADRRVREAERVRAERATVRAARVPYKVPAARCTVQCPACAECFATGAALRAHVGRRHGGAS